MSIKDNPEILTVPEVAERLRVSPKSIYKHVAFLGGYRVGTSIRFHWPTVLERLSAWQRNNPQTLGSQPNDLEQKP